MILKLSLCERQNVLREGIPTKIYTYKIKGSRAKQYLFKTIRSLLQKGYGGFPEPAVILDDAEWKKDGFRLCIIHYYHPYTQYALLEVTVEHGDNFQYPGDLTKF